MRGSFFLFISLNGPYFPIFLYAFLSLFVVKNWTFKPNDVTTPGFAVFICYLFLLLFFYCSLSLVQESAWGVNLRSYQVFSELYFSLGVYSHSLISSVYEDVLESLAPKREQEENEWIWENGHWPFKFSLWGTLTRGGRACNNPWRNNNNGCWASFLHFCNQKHHLVMRPLILYMCRTSSFLSTLAIASYVLVGPATSTQLPTWRWAVGNSH